MSTIIKKLLVLRSALLLVGCVQPPPSNTTPTGSATPTAAPPTATPQPTVDTSALVERWLAGEPCSAPCWEGITPGVTTVTEAQRLMAELMPGEEPEDEPYHDGSGWLTWKWDQRPNCDVSLSYDMRSAGVIIDGAFVRYCAAFRLGDLIATYGEPSHIFASVSRVIGGTRYSVELLFEPERYIVSMWGLTKPHINEDLLVEDPRFFLIGDITSYYPYLREHALPWQGMQSFDFYCRNLQRERDCAGFERSVEYFRLAEAELASAAPLPTFATEKQTPAELRGYYYSGFETSVFQACGSDERWWSEELPRLVGERYFDMTRWDEEPIFAHLRGSVSGQRTDRPEYGYGHLGQYPRQFSVLEVREPRVGDCAGG